MNLIDTDLSRNMVIDEKGVNGMLYFLVKNWIDITMIAEEKRNEREIVCKC